MQRHDSGETRVIPVILRPCDWTNAPFGKLQALPENGQPVSQWRSSDKAWLSVAQGLRRTLGELSLKTAEAEARPREKWVLSIEAELALLTSEQLSSIADLLREISGDARVQITKVTKGSVRLQLDISHEGARRLQTALSAAKLKTILGFVVIDFVRLDPKKLEVVPRSTHGLVRSEPAIAADGKGLPAARRLPDSPDKDRRFQDLYRRYYRPIVAFFVRQGFSGDEARDLAQDTFVRAYRAMDQYRSDVEWNYLKAIASRVWVNEIRKRSASRRSTAEVSLERDLTPAGSPLASEEGVASEQLAERRARLQEAIAALPAGLRSSLLLRLQGLTYKEIQGALNISMATVKARLSEARRRLKDLLDDDWSDIDDHTE